jgi:hypothetical protein
VRGDGSASECAAAASKGREQSGSRGVTRQEAGVAEADTVARFLKDERMQDAAGGGFRPRS